ncbi:60S ribosomal protein L6 [Sparganum proliferum]
MAGFQKAFNAIDTENHGFITIDELKDYMHRMHYKESFVTKWISLFDPEGSGRITYKQYCDTLGLRPCGSKPSSPAPQTQCPEKTTGELTPTSQAKPAADEQTKDSNGKAKGSHNLPTHSGSDEVMQEAEPTIHPVIVGSQSTEPAEMPAKRHAQASKGRRQRNSKSGSQKNSISETKTSDSCTGAAAMDVIEPSQTEPTHAEPLIGEHGQRPRKKRGGSSDQSNAKGGDTIDTSVISEQEVPVEQQTSAVAQKSKHPRKQGKTTPRTSSSVDEGMKEAGTNVTTEQKQSNQPDSHGNNEKPSQPGKRAHFLSETLAPDSPVQAKPRVLKRTYVTYERKRNSQSESKAFPPGRLYGESGGQSPLLASVPGGPAKPQKPFFKQRRPVRMRASKSETDSPAQVTNIKQWAKLGTGDVPKKQHGLNKHDRNRPAQPKSAEKSADGSPLGMCSGENIPQPEPCEGLEGQKPEDAGNVRPKKTVKEGKRRFPKPSRELRPENNGENGPQGHDSQRSSEKNSSIDFAGKIDANGMAILTPSQEDQAVVEETIQPVTLASGLQAAPRFHSEDTPSEEEMEMADPFHEDGQSGTQLPVEDEIRPVDSTKTLQCASVPPVLPEESLAEEKMMVDSSSKECKSDGRLAVGGSPQDGLTPAHSSNPIIEEITEVKDSQKERRDDETDAPRKAESKERRQRQQDLNGASEPDETNRGKKTKKHSKNNKRNSSSSVEVATATTLPDESVQHNLAVVEEPNRDLSSRSKQQKKGSKHVSESSDAHDKCEQQSDVLPNEARKSVDPFPEDRLREGQPFVEDIIQPTVSAEALQSAAVRHTPEQDTPSEEEMEMADPFHEEQPPADQSAEHNLAVVEEPNRDLSSRSKRQKKGSKHVSESSDAHDKCEQQSDVLPNEARKSVDPFPEDRLREGQPFVEDIIQPTVSAEALQSAAVRHTPEQDTPSEEEMEMADPFHEEYPPADQSAVEETLQPVMTTTAMSPPSLGDPTQIGQPVTEPGDELQPGETHISKTVDNRKGTPKQTSKRTSESEGKSQERRKKDKQSTSAKGSVMAAIPTETVVTDEVRPEIAKSSEGSGKKKRREEKPRAVKEPKAESKAEPKLEAGAQAKKGENGKGAAVETDIQAASLSSEQVTPLTTGSLTVPASGEKSGRKQTSSLSEIADKLEEVVEIATQQQQQQQQQQQEGKSAGKQKSSGRTGQAAQQKKKQSEKVQSMNTGDLQVQPTDTKSSAKTAVKEPKKTAKKQPKEVVACQPKTEEASNNSTQKKEQKSGGRKRKHVDQGAKEGSNEASGRKAAKKKRTDKQAKKASRKHPHSDEVGGDGSAPEKETKRPRRGHLETGRFPRSFAVQASRRLAQHRRDGARVSTNQLGKRIKGEKTKLSRAHRQADKPSKGVRRWKLRASLRKPGTVVILLAGRHRGKRAVCVGRHAHSGLLLITGPYSVNGIPVRRVHPDYVLATKTVIRLSNFRIPKRLHSKSYFARSKPSRKDLLKKAAENIFVDKASEKSAYKVSDERKKDQVTIDKQVLQAIRRSPSHKLLFGYLKSTFSLSKHDYPHKMVF